MYKILFFQIVLQVVFCITCVGQDADSLTDLTAFLELGRFSDRGIAISPFKSIDQSAPACPDSIFASLPKDFLNKFERQEFHAASKEVDWPWLKLRSLPDGSQRQSSQVVRFAVERIRVLGFMELFRKEYYTYFDPPLIERIELLNRLQEIVDKARVVHAVFFNKELKMTERILATGTLRGLSLEFDTAVVSGLSDTERVRLASVISILLPHFISETDKNQKKLFLGSEQLTLSD